MGNRWKNYENETRLAGFLIVLVLLVINLSGVWLIYKAKYRLDEEQRFRMEGISRQAAVLLSSKSGQSEDSLWASLQRLAEQTGVFSINLVDERGRVILGYDKYQPWPLAIRNKRMLHSPPIPLRDLPKGMAVLSPAYVKQGLWYIESFYSTGERNSYVSVELPVPGGPGLGRAVTIQLMMALGGFLAISILGIFYLRNVFSPFRQMAYTARTGLGTEKSRPSSDVELVMQTYEKMVAELRVKGQTLQGLYDDAKERAEKSEFINELIVDNIDKGIITIDPKGGVIAGNRTAFDLTGCQNLDQLRAWLKARGLLSLGSHDLPLELESDTQRYGKLHLQIEAAFFNHSGAGGQGKILVLSDVTYVRKMEEQAHLAEQSTLLGQASQKLLEKIGPELSRIRQDIRDCGLQTSIEAQVAEIEQAVQNLGKYITYQPAGDNTDKGPAIVYTSLAMSKVMDMLTKVAPTDSTVLITGESGTGKELVARKIHQLSSRGKGPFVSVNCGALPESLLESELFGYLKGAFTGAAKDKPGLLKAAEDGSFFLDEVSELSPALQVKLLRVLQEREAIPVGGTRPFKVDARILAASNQNLERMVKEGRFRQDLFFRLNVFPLEIPPLRKRPEDIPLLVEHFLKKYSAKSKTSDKHLTKAAMDIVTEYQWPGNIRELENAIERANVIAPGSTIRPEHFGLAVEAGNGQVKWGDAPGLLEVSAKAAAQAEARLIKQALEEFAWNKSRAARALKISYRVMLKKIKDYELQ